MWVSVIFRGHSCAMDTTDFILLTRPRWANLWSLRLLYLALFLEVECTLTLSWASFRVCFSSWTYNWNNRTLCSHWLLPNLRTLIIMYRCSKMRHHSAYGIIQKSYLWLIRMLNSLNTLLLNWLVWSGWWRYLYL